jgi:hypothetical protein
MGTSCSSSPHLLHLGPAARRFTARSRCSSSCPSLCTSPLARLPTAPPGSRALSHAITTGSSGSGSGGAPKASFGSCAHPPLSVTPQMLRMAAPR